ncbi:rRNA maturation RNase YbeY [Segetibacter aerophilus]|uniref:Endoribonuclease YbeY n=1 Tax=Segetibacter aerophilus TaxID=670293 RepID=A0A512BCA8_9BACT|nr:rRNA maturation RNase YbeY [Segetibacter aerophilus]GEO09554.1 endoribonuclease YbeY [Segetibacter aerophilus]
MPLVSFNYADVSQLSLKGRKEIKQFVVEIFRLEGKALEHVNYVFCSDEYLLDINRSFLNHDYYTDIITFDLSEGHKTIGEIYISVDRVKENAASNLEVYSREMVRVIFHGALHLIGYKDKRKSEITIMREKEDYYLRLFEEK